MDIRELVQPNRYPGFTHKVRFNVDPAVSTEGLRAELQLLDIRMPFPVRVYLDRPLPPAWEVRVGADVTPSSDDRGESTIEVQRMGSFPSLDGLIGPHFVGYLYHLLRDVLIHELDEHFWIDGHLWRDPHVHDKRS